MPRLGRLLLLLAFCLPTLAQAQRVIQKTPPVDGHFITRADGARIGALVAVTAVASLFDRSIARAVHRETPALITQAGNASDAVNELVAPGALLLGGTVYAAGMLSGRRGIAEIGAHEVQALLLAYSAAGALKLVLGRADPASTGDSLPHDYSLFGGTSFNRRSLPSGHTVVAFAAASSISAELLEHSPRLGRIVSPALYGGATVMAISRLRPGRHWLSDVVLGTGIGIFSGRKVVQYSHAHGPTPVDMALLSGSVMQTENGPAVVATLRF